MRQEGLPKERRAPDLLIPDALRAAVVDATPRGLPGLRPRGCMFRLASSVAARAVAATPAGCFASVRGALTGTTGLAAKHALGASAAARAQATQACKAQGAPPVHPVLLRQPTHSPSRCACPELSTPASASAVLFAAYRALLRAPPSSLPRAGPPPLQPLQADSVKRKRVKKMNRHKKRKLIKRERNKNRGA